MVDRKALALIASLVCTGCAGRSNDFLVDSRFNEYELEVITHAAQEWADATGSPDATSTFTSASIVVNGEFTSDTWDTWDGEHARMYRISQGDSGYQDLKEQQGRNFSGITEAGQAIALVWSDYIQEDGTVYWTMLEYLTLHELGHHFGLHHGAGDLMSDQGINVVKACVDQETVDSFCAEHECNNSHSTCK